MEQESNLVQASGSCFFWLGVSLRLHSYIGEKVESPQVFTIEQLHRLRQQVEALRQINTKIRAWKHRQRGADAQAELAAPHRVRAKKRAASTVLMARPSAAKAR